MSEGPVSTQYSIDGDVTVGKFNSLIASSTNFVILAELAKAVLASVLSISLRSDIFLLLVFTLLANVSDTC